MAEERRLEQVRRNEEAFRQVNERIAEVVEPFTGIAEGSGIDVVCECGNMQCTEPIHLTLDEYRQIRERRDHFVVVPEHENVEIDDVTDERPGFRVVRKRMP